MDVRAERGMSAPPEVVFNTATDPDRLSAWLPAPLLRSDAKPRMDCAVGGEGALQAHWGGETDPSGWSAKLEVRPLDPGGATALLELVADQSDQPLAELADESLANLAEEVAENFTVG